MLNHELQVIVTVTLLTVTAILALVSDFVRIRAMRRTVGAAPKADASVATHVLVPDVPAQVVSNGRSSRLAAALKQPRRQLSEGAKAAIERGAQLATPPRKPVSATEAVRSLQQVG